MSRTVRITDWRVVWVPAVAVTAALVVGPFVTVAPADAAPVAATSCEVER